MRKKTTRDDAPARVVCRHQAPACDPDTASLHEAPTRDPVTYLWYAAVPPLGPRLPPTSRKMREVQNNVVKKMLSSKKKETKQNIFFSSKISFSSTIQTMQVQGRRYSKPLKTYEKNITKKIEQGLVSENTLSTNPCKHQYKHPFSEPFKITLQKIAQYKHTYISVRLLCFSHEKTAGYVLPYSKLRLIDCEFEKMFNMTKFCIFGSFPMVYYLPHFDKLF